MGYGCFNGPNVMHFLQEVFILIELFLEMYTCLLACLVIVNISVSSFTATNHQNQVGN